MTAPRLGVLEVSAFTRDVKTRIPFRYGTAVVTGEPIAHVRLVAEVAGAAVTGVSAAALPPLWFDKNPACRHDDNIRDLLRSLRAAADAYRSAGPDTPFGLHRAREPEVRRALEGQNDLTAGFGIALLDAAVADAVCRRTERTFHRGLLEDLFGFGPLDVPPRPLDRIAVRHTVGMGDPVTAADVRERVGDGLPETLEEVVRTYGVRFFKIKVSADAAASLERLRRIAAVLDRDAGDYRATVDGNEQFHDPAEVAAFLAALETDPALGALRRRTLWIEQPLERGLALSARVAGPFPQIIDESDGSDDAVDRALALGYAGISAKNCKGLYRTLHSFRRTREAGATLSSEDLMNIPVVPLQQDLCVAAALGIGHSERNGHHYIRAFEYLSPAEREAALREFPSLYRAEPAGVRIEDGSVSLAEVNAAPFGVRSLPDWGAMRHEWTA